MDNYINSLNTNQRDAVKDIDGKIVSLAGPGSGKTKTLVSKYVYLVDEIGIMTGNILAITFTNKAANEMRSRVRALIGNQDTGFICTIHGLCKQILKHDAEFMHYPKRFGILDESDSRALIKESMKRSGIDSKDLTVEDAKTLIHDEIMLDINHYCEIMSATNLDGILGEISAGNRLLYNYCLLKKKAEVCDFDDLILFARYILLNSPERRKYWVEKFRYILVDEYQDCSKMQVELIDILASQSECLYMVGDPDQCIYQFRGAKPQYIIERAKEAMAEKKRYDLELNYRSNSRIVEASQAFIRHNALRLDHHIEAVKQEQGQLLYAHCRTCREEALWVANQIKELIGQGYEYEDIAILARSRAYLRNAEEALIEAKIPYHMVRGASFYDNKDVKMCINYLKLVCRKSDDAFLATVNEPRRQMGKKKIDAIREYAASNNMTLYDAMKTMMNSCNEDERKVVSRQGREFINKIEYLHKQVKTVSVSYMLQKVLHYLGYEEQVKQDGSAEELNMIAELKASVASYERLMEDNPTVEDYLSDIAIYTDIADDYESNQVTVSTVHGVKGLEFSAVFVMGMCQNVFPSGNVRCIQDLEVERNIMYVAVTRAKDRLYLSSAEGRNPEGKYMCPSRFIFEMEEFLEFVYELPEHLRQQSIKDIACVDQMYRNQANLRVGMPVRHKVFGHGQVLEMDDRCITVKFEGHRTSTPLSISAPLELIEPTT